MGVLHAVERRIDKIIVMMEIVYSIKSLPRSEPRKLLVMDRYASCNPPLFVVCPPLLFSLCRHHCRSFELDQVANATCGPPMGRIYAFVRMLARWRTQDRSCRINKSWLHPLSCYIRHVYTSSIFRRLTIDGCVRM